MSIFLTLEDPSFHLSYLGVRLKKPLLPSDTVSTNTFSVLILCLSPYVLQFINSLMNDKLAECVTISIIMPSFPRGTGSTEVKSGKPETSNNYPLGIPVFTSMGIILHLMND